MRKFLFAGGCTVAMMCAATMASAQQNQSQYQSGQGRSATRSYSAGTQNGQQSQAGTQNGQQSQAGNADHKIAMWLANCNKTEIKLGRYAARHAESSEVRSFGNQLAQDHEQLLERLHSFAPEANMTSSTSGETSGSDRNSESDSSESRDSQHRNASSQQSRGTRTWNPEMVGQQISDRIARKAREELGEKEGAEFDRCFVGQQLVAHQQDLAKMEVLRQYASSSLRSVIDEGIQTVESHEQEARELMKKVASNEGSNQTSQRDERSQVSRRTDSSDRDYSSGGSSSSNRESSSGNGESFGGSSSSGNRSGQSSNRGQSSSGNGESSGGSSSSSNRSGQSSNRGQSSSGNGESSGGSSSSSNRSGQSSSSGQSSLGNRNYSSGSSSSNNIDSSSGNGDYSGGSSSSSNR